MIEAPASPEDAKDIEVYYGPNIKPFPDSNVLTDEIEAKAMLKVGDNITTDHIMPAGAAILPYRSNIPKLSEFCFRQCDPNFSENCKKEGKGFIIGGSNYGQGSSREHAALVPLYLGIKAVIAKSFARIHAANLVNAGIMPLTFQNPDDYDKIDQFDELKLTNVFEGLDSGKMILHNETKDVDIPLVSVYTDRQKEILKAGDLLQYTKHKNH